MRPRPGRTRIKPGTNWRHRRCWKRPGRSRTARSATPTEAMQSDTHPGKKQRAQRQERLYASLRPLLPAGIQRRAGGPCVALNPGPDQIQMKRQLSARDPKRTSQDLFAFLKRQVEDRRRCAPRWQFTRRVLRNRRSEQRKSTLSPLRSPQARFRAGSAGISRQNQVIDTFVHLMEVNTVLATEASNETVKCYQFNSI